VRLTRLIGNLLENVHIESGRLENRSQRIAIEEAVQDNDALIGALMQQRQQRLEQEIPEVLLLVDGDGPRLTQVFVNLLANASKFAPEDSVVRVGATHGEGRVVVWVEDEGPGVPQIESGSVFDRFYRGPEQEPEPGGLGLGLWIVKSIIERHGGQVSARRTPEGRTRFEVTLRACDESEVAE